MSVNFQDFLSPLDSARFGFGVAKVDDFSSGIDALLDQFRANSVKLVLSRVPSDNIPLINELEDRGFRIKDTQLTYRYSLGSGLVQPRADSDDFRIRKFEPSDTEALVRVARESFSGYGHYAADSKLDAVKCAEIYEDWARNTCRDPKVADYIIIAERKGALIGYLSFKVKSAGEEKYAAGGMGAVSNEHRSLGAFSAIVRAGLAWGQKIGLAWEEHNVIAANLPVNHAFIRCGFKPSHSVVTLHGWL
jgi:ribosomal protein S18 acetylase RimI-like enzyme